MSRKHIVISALITLQLIVLLNNLGLPYSQYFWYCDFAPALLAVFYYFNNIQAMKGFLNIILFGQLGYVIIILAKVLFGLSLMNFVFVFELTPSYVFATVSIHLSAVIAFLATYRKATKPIALAYSLTILTVTYFVVMNFAHPHGDDLTNYNLIYHSHLLSDFEFYTQFWIVLGFTFVALPTHLFQLAVSRYCNSHLFQS